MNSHQSIPDKTLKATYQLLNDWEQTPNFDLLLSRLRENDNSEVTDMTATLCREIFRKKALIDWTIDKISDKRPRGRIYKLLRIAVGQLLQEQLPEALICDTTVRYCRKKFNKFEASFVNQFLRKLTSKPFPEPPSNISLCLSPELLKQWRKHFSEDQIKSWSKVLLDPPGISARLSVDSPNIDDLKECLNKLNLPEWSEGFDFYEITNAKDFLKRNDGRLYIQDPATICSINMMKPKSGEIIADLCAAPGGKSRLIAELMQGEGKVISCDISSFRLKVLKQNLKSFEIVEVRQNDATNSNLKEKSLDAVLLDVPCSNTGVIRRKADVRWSFSAKKLKDLNNLQLSILEDSTKLIKEGGRLIYSTCSIDPEENEAVVEKFLKNKPQFKIADSNTLYPSEKHDGSHCTRIEYK